MNAVKTFIAVTSLAAIAACSTVMTTPQAGFLTSYAELQSQPDSALATRRSAVSIDPARVRIGEIEWRAKTSTEISSEEQQALLTQLRSELQRGVQALPAASSGTPVVLRAAITRVEPVSPALNTVGSLLLIGPLDRGGAAVEIEAIDAATGRQVAALTLGYFAPLSELGARFQKLAPAEIALRKAANDFAALLKPA